MMSLGGVSTADLRQLRDAVALGAINCPLTDASLRAHGFGAFVHPLRSALPFEQREVVVHVLDLLIDERVQAERPPLELVWTGPDTSAPQTRDTAVVLEDLFTRATKRVMVAGYVFRQGASILAPLHAALVRGVEARMFLDLDGQATSEAGIPEFAAKCVRDFIHYNWPFGPPFPDFFYDPRTARPGPEILLHAKCAVVDGRFALVTSANFTSWGQTRHIEVGVLIDDVHFAARLEGHFNALVAQGALLASTRQEGT
jgi:phosphatidylserine/phosphatidylglycerophosphate/cardiolipin synthase-like enzyme